MNQVLGVNSSFSLLAPNLQIYWDSTSLGLLKECPKKYYYTMIAGAKDGLMQGYVPRQESVHLTFGILLHGALERYHHARASGKGYDEGVRLAVRWCLSETWNPELKRGWASDDKNKNRPNLIRTVVWYLTQFREDPLKTIILANGRPAVEMSFRFETTYKAHQTGEPFMLCGHLDRLAELESHNYIMDIKSTKYTLDEEFFDKFSPDNQFSTYHLATKVAWAVPIHGLVVDGAQIAVTFSRFLRGTVNRSETQLDEWYRDLGFYLTAAQMFAQRNHWPMNDKSCGNYGGCPFRKICSKAPSVRGEWLEAGYVKRPWDPLQVRGDI